MPTFQNQDWTDRHMRDMPCEAEPWHAMCLHAMLLRNNWCMRAGDRDGMVKYWDLRKALEPVTAAVLPQHAAGQNYLLPTVRPTPPALVLPFEIGKKGHMQ